MYLYYDPEKFGLTFIGEVEWREEAYQFDLTGVWQDPDTKAIYYADDSGCSCPVPFECYHRKEDLTRGTKQQVIAHLRKFGAVKAEALIARVRALPIS